jgi:hypothetical protein
VLEAVAEQARAEEAEQLQQNAWANNPLAEAEQEMDVEPLPLLDDDGGAAGLEEGGEVQPAVVDDVQQLLMEGNVDEAQDGGVQLLPNGLVVDDDDNAWANGPIPDMPLQDDNDELDGLANGHQQQLQEDFVPEGQWVHPEANLDNNSSPLFNGLGVDDSSPEPFVE